jgi:quinol monooxygenase YgiN
VPGIHRYAFQEDTMKVITTVRGMMKETDEKKAREVHNAIFNRVRKTGDQLGAVGHQTFLNPQKKGEFLAIDTWPSMEALQKFMGHPSNPAQNIGGMFQGQPEITVWVESGYDGFYKG